MLSYQHAYHAGNPADLHKHQVLAGLIALLTRKARPITYMETHAGRGLYDLGAPEALKTGEAAMGIGIATLTDGPYAQVIARVRQQHGPRAYPGSPAIAGAMLRPGDRMVLMELHPAEHAALRANFPSAEVHHRNGYEGVLALAPPTPRKGLVLIDPSYEVKSEYATAAEFTRALVARWPEATVLIWYPILRAGRHETLVEGLHPLRARRHETHFALKDGKGMTGSGLLLVNAPFGSEKILNAPAPVGVSVAVP